ncbi:MAG: hypothetical protein HLUCCA11_14565 [Phormidesmis priestleyi Ana]|uniref:Uncharacterized protein n=1 Tax=Phormidesmis priestleyi Ana TaxID=1666911 RepID=A0A0P7ZIQ7_9CYAN|nr:MAG: hypothetical protein HLUCCA11_14565 [Phormidesmis priestleyi Ana]
MIRLTYGDQQQFRFRHSDINILGAVDPVNNVELIKRSEYCLNGSEPVHFYIEPKVEKKGPGKYPYGCYTPACHRLRDRPGHFNLEISVNHPKLMKGWNTVSIEVEYGDQALEHKSVEFHWNPHPIPLPLSLTDLSTESSIQAIGQAINGAFEIDAERNVIRSRSPVGSDVLFLIGSPHQSQEATYDVRFTGRKVFMGVSDFFTAHVEQSPDLGIKPGYCTSGLATINAQGNAQVWIAWGDNLIDNEQEWVVKTAENTAWIDIELHRLYSVRHQTIIGNGINGSRFKIWPKDKPEPKAWLCEEHNKGLDPKFPRNQQASFGLFQYFGSPTEWSNIVVKALEIDPRSIKLRRTKKNYAKRLLTKLAAYRKQYLKLLKNY